MLVYRNGLSKLYELNDTLFCLLRFSLHICHGSKLYYVCMSKCNASHFTVIGHIALVLSNGLYNATTPDSMLLNDERLLCPFPLIVCDLTK